MDDLTLRFNWSTKTKFESACELWWRTEEIITWYAEYGSHATRGVPRVLHCLFNTRPQNTFRYRGRLGTNVRRCSGLFLSSPLCCGLRCGIGPGWPYRSSRCFCCCRNSCCWLSCGCCRCRGVHRTATTHACLPAVFNQNWRPRLAPTVNHVGCTVLIVVNVSAF